jgi:hypothetical protein
MEIEKKSVQSIEFDQALQTIAGSRSLAINKALQLMNIYTLSRV